MHTPLPMVTPGQVRWRPRPVANDRAGDLQPPRAPGEEADLLTRQHRSPCDQDAHPVPLQQDVRNQCGALWFGFTGGQSVTVWPAFRQRALHIPARVRCLVVHDGVMSVLVPAPDRLCPCSRQWARRRTPRAARRSRRARGPAFRGFRPATATSTARTTLAWATRRRRTRWACSSWGWRWRGEPRIAPHCPCALGSKLCVAACQPCPCASPPSLHASMPPCLHASMPPCLHDCLPGR
jgi:hypothetical protein